jgi:hypothetical protein
MPKSSLFQNRENLPPANICIYCGKTEPKVKLTDEHIIPYSLGGHLVLPKASCKDCADITKALEGYVGRNVFQDVRIEHNFPTRNPKERPTELPVYTSVNDPQKAQAILIPTKDYPGTVMLLHPEPPGILLDRAPNTPFAIKPWITTIAPPERTQRLTAERGRTLHLKKLEFDKFGRLIMKVALGFAVSIYGLDCFDAKDARRIILKQEPDVHRWVGGTTKEMREVVRQPGHIHLATVYPQEIRGVPYLMAQISLFSYLCTPVFTAVLGKLTQAGIERALESNLAPR